MPSGEGVRAAWLYETVLQDSLVISMVLYIFVDTSILDLTNVLVQIIFQIVVLGSPRKKGLSGPSVRWAEITYDLLLSAHLRGF